MSKKIAIFYHLWPNNNNGMDKVWPLIFDDQMHKLRYSGLYDACESIHIGVNADTVELPYTFDKFKIQYNDYYYDEMDTLKSLYKFCVDNPDYKILYFQCKGTYRLTVSDVHKSISVNSWRLYMEYFNILKWKECIELLNDYDTVGTELLVDDYYGNFWGDHYCGNFWWANASYIKTLDPNYLTRNSEKPHETTHISEHWLLSNIKLNVNGTFSPIANSYSFKNITWQSKKWPEHETPDRVGNLDTYNRIFHPKDYME